MTQKTPEVRRLAAIYARMAGDSFLDLILALGTGKDIWFGLPLRCIVGGQVLRGTLAPPEQFARDVEQKLTTYFAAADVKFNNSPDLDDPDAATRTVKEILLKHVEDGAYAEGTRRVRAFEDRMSELVGKFFEENPTDEARPFDVDRFPDDIALDAIAYLSPKSAFTLENAQIFVPQLGWQSAGTIRLSAREVSAWWIGSTEPSTQFD
jgi:hypothetical protein